MTSAALPSGTAVRNKMFPKTRSWFALGAPLELLSPLSVVRIVFALNVVIWPLDGLVLDWPGTTVAWLAGATVVSFGVWWRLRQARELSPRACYLLALGANLLTLGPVWSGRALGPVLVAVLFLLPAAAFVALFLGTRAVLSLQGANTVGLFMVLLGPLATGGAIVVAVVASLMLLCSALTIAMLVAAAWSRGAIDPDTGLPNGVGLTQRLAPVVSEASDAQAGTFMLATLHLAGVDDARQALGYHVGTELLRRAVEDLGQVVPTDTLIARVGTDELVMARRLALRATPTGHGPGADDPGPAVAGGLSTGLATDQAPPPTAPAEAIEAGRALADELARTIASGRYLVNGVEVSLRAHIGLVFAPWDGTEVAELVRRSSLNARRAATAGLTTVLWDGDHDAMTGEDLALLSDLRLADERGELWLAYQPQVAATSATLISVEALLRWDSPVHGSVPPGRFIILAERTGLIDRLTDWVMHQALDAQVRWRAAGIEVPVAVNLSAKTLGRPGLAAWILAELANRGLPASALTVEVTETAAADLLAAVHLLGPLHESGVRVSIDDFGTGYTSMAALPYLPLDEIKVDMQFVRRAPTSRADEAIVRSVHELAHRLGLVTVAEGVEDGVVRDLMVEVGFDLLQGYHFAKGLAEADLMAFIAQRVAAAAASAQRTVAL